MVKKFVEFMDDSIMEKFVTDTNEPFKVVLDSHSTGIMKMYIVIKDGSELSSCVEKYIDSANIKRSGGVMKFHLDIRDSDGESNEMTRLVSNIKDECGCKLVTEFIDALNSKIDEYKDFISFYSHIKHFHNSATC